MNTAHALIIGGPARCGKSTAAAVLRRKLGCVHIPGDALVAAVSPWMKSTFQPTIRHHWPVESWLAAIKSRDQHVAKLLLGAVTPSVDDGDTTVLDGTVWPKHIAWLQVPVRSVFMVDTGDQSERLLHIFHDEHASNNWQREAGWSEDDVVRWAAYNRVRSQAYVDEALESGCEIVDIAELGIERAVEAAVTKLCNL